MHFHQLIIIACASANDYRDIIVADINECLLDAECLPNQECINTPGSYQCTSLCGDGFRRSQDSQTCEGRLVDTILLTENT